MEDWKDRLKAEYTRIKERYKKLKAYNNKKEQNFILSAPFFILLCYAATLHRMSIKRLVIYQGYNLTPEPIPLLKRILNAL